MNTKYLHPASIAGHAATLVVVFSQLISKQELSAYEHQSLFFIALALPLLALAYVMDPTDSFEFHNSIRIYLTIYPLAHIAGALALLFLFANFSIKAAIAFGATATLFLVVLLIYRIRFLREPAVKEAFLINRRIRKEIAAKEKQNEESANPRCDVLDK